MENAIKTCIMQCNKNTNSGLRSVTTYTVRPSLDNIFLYKLFPFHNQKYLIIMYYKK